MISGRNRDPRCALSVDSKPYLARPAVMRLSGSHTWLQIYAPYTLYKRYPPVSKTTSGGIPVMTHSRNSLRLSESKTASLE